MSLNLVKIIILVCVLILLPNILFNILTFSNPKTPKIDTVENTSNSDKQKVVGMVLGAEVYGNQPSNVLKWRLKKAAELYKNKNINKILVSGSNQSEFYNEPQAMQNYLITSESIPDNDIILDYGGMRTYDSCWRAKNVFKLDKITIITQAFHLGRSSFICHWLGIETTTSAANDSYFDVTLRGQIREIGAAWNAIWDLSTGTKPIISGDGTELNQFN